MEYAILGTGTGRSGTVSLSKILNSCRNSNVTHENKRYMIPYNNPDTVIQRINNEFTDVGHSFFGDVNYTYFMHLERITAPVKWIFLHRDMEDTVNSWLNKLGGMSRCYPKDRPHIQHRYWNQFFPQYDFVNNAKEAWEMYWRSYESMSKCIPNSFHIDMLDLNKDDKLEEMYDFLNMPESWRAFPRERKFNSSEELHR